MRILLLMLKILILVIFMMILIQRIDFIESVNQNLLQERQLNELNVKENSIKNVQVRLM